MKNENLETIEMASTGPWVSKKGFAENMKISTGTVDGWMRRHWYKNQHYKVIGRTTLINMQRVTEWLCQKD